jgi:hypothetical protein
MQETILRSLTYLSNNLARSFGLAMGEKWQIAAMGVYLLCEGRLVFRVHWPMG